MADFTHSARGLLADRLVGLAAEYVHSAAWICVRRPRSRGGAGLVRPRARGGAGGRGREHGRDHAVDEGTHGLEYRGSTAVRADGAGGPWYSQRVTPGVQGMAAQMEARGHALAGDAGPARSLLEQAQTLIERAASTPEDEPPWMYFYGEDWFTLQRGMAQLHLRNYGAAADLLDGLQKDLARVLPP